MARGTIKRLLADRRFGFITAAGRDYFFDEDALQSAAFEELAEGADVLFEPAVDAHDEGPRAERVRLARDEAPDPGLPDEFTSTTAPPPG